MTRFTIKHQCENVGFFLLTFLISLSATPAWAEDGADHMSGVGLLRGLGIFACIVGIVGLLLIQFNYRSRLPRGTYHWLLLVGLFILPITATTSTALTVLEGTKSVDACASCHVMKPFVDDLKNLHSATLASRHYRNSWIAKDQCYACHVTYGVNGTFEGKRDGFRHWLYYVTGTYQDPIQYTGSYPNSNCINCHGKTLKWQRVKSHHALFSDLSTGKIACIDCHGPPHPLPQDRHAQSNLIKNIHSQEVSDESL